MRFPTFPNIIRTFYTLSNYSRVSSQAQYKALNNFSRVTVYKSMPTFPFLSSLFSSSSSSSDMSYPVQKSDDEWQAVLSKEQFRVLREKGTEAPFVGKYDKHMPDTGIYTCAACDAPLYKASHKFKSGCGWPAYFDNIPGAVTRHTDSTLGMSRTEIVCSNCGGHLGHVFKGEGYANPTDERHCVNSVSMKFSPEDEVVDKADSKV
ncbi:methionine-R-sulfoxide reductase-like protein SelR [Mollisia scopiformis]|uniref:Peptide-methionine (R)-S-oxide reductase n=1 Tax=Mollisia scopiformis TaxID=149040 RepID=A0A194WWT5_MOLSC|nr:methionine-R-sulfoxide reductase-like protein SelR [Mollisia scopiformis]KUJ12438.1 methionine-R-sulfoxide reductase-like protein SelR [Mollisia scopiformis]